MDHTRHFDLSMRSTGIADLMSQRTGHHIALLPSVLRWGDTSSSTSRQSNIHSIQTSPIYQSYAVNLFLYDLFRIILTGSDRGQLSLFKNEYSSQASVNRTMERVNISGSSNSSSSHKKSISAIRFIEEHVFATASLDCTLKIWDCTTLSNICVVTSIASREGISSLEIVRTFGENMVVMTGTTSGSLCMRDLRSRNGAGDKTVKMGMNAISCVAMSGRYTLASGDSGGRIELRDIRSMRAQPLVRLNGSEQGSRASHASSSAAFSPARPRAKEIITEDLWAIAMGKQQGKKRPASTYEGPLNDPRAAGGGNLTITKAQVASFGDEAHSEEVVSIHNAAPNIWVSSSKDRSIKVFSETSGKLLRAIKLSNKPTAAVYFHKNMFVADRQGIERISGILEDDTLNQRIDNPHQGSVTAICNSADWGLCTGGSDQHLFLYAL